MKTSIKIISEFDFLNKKVKDLEPNQIARFKDTDEVFLFQSETYIFSYKTNLLIPIDDVLEKDVVEIDKVEITIEQEHVDNNPDLTPKENEIYSKELKYYYALYK